LAVEDFTAAVADIPSNLKPLDPVILRDVDNFWINAAFNVAENRFNACHRQLAVDVSATVWELRTRSNPGPSQPHRERDAQRDSESVQY
jgi:hypothetical protein